MRLSSVGEAVEAGAEDGEDAGVEEEEEDKEEEEAVTADEDKDGDEEEHKEEEVKVEEEEVKEEPEAAAEVKRLAKEEAELKGDDALGHVLGVVKRFVVAMPADVMDAYQRRAEKRGDIPSPTVEDICDRLSYVPELYRDAWERVGEATIVPNTDAELSMRDRAFIFVWTINLPAVFMLVTTALDLLNARPVLGDPTAHAGDAELLAFRDGLFAALGKLQEVQKPTTLYRVVSEVEHGAVTKHGDLRGYLIASKRLHAFTTDQTRAKPRSGEVVLTLELNEGERELRVRGVSSLSMNNSEAEVIIYTADSNSDVREDHEVDDDGVCGDDEDDGDDGASSSSLSMSSSEAEVIIYTADSNSDVGEDHEVDDHGDGGGGGEEDDSDDGASRHQRTEVGIETQPT